MRLATVVAFAAALLGGALAFGLSMSRSADQVADEVTCFAAPSLDAAAAGSPSEPGVTLAAMCDHAWTSGVITWPPAGPAPAAWEACIGHLGGVDVFPAPSGGNANLCAALGLDPLPAGYGEALARYRSFEDDVFARFGDETCIEQTVAQGVAADVLDAHGYSSWTVEVGGFSPDAPCAVADLDPVNGVLTLRGRIRPEIEQAVQSALTTDACGPAIVLTGRVRGALVQAGYGDWTVSIDHELTSTYPCVAGFNPDPASKAIVLTGRATGG